MSDLDLFKTLGKYNTSVKLTEEDKKNGVRIYCHEPYAQDLYDAMVRHEKSKNIIPKDLKEGAVCKVVPKLISYKDRLIHAEDASSSMPVIIPFREYSRDIETLKKGGDSEFLVMIYKSSKFGENFGSEKKALSISYKQELFDHASEDNWFDVKIVKLIKGGYLALYKNEIECFIPGSHAAANIVHNFNDMLNKTLTVMVDNYDQSNDLFILSYKKYVTQSMPVMIENLEFCKEYTGVLTSKPYDFGVFVEIDGYFTGLVHQSEFDDYATIKRTLKPGDTLTVYVKDITSKGSQFRIVLTLKSDNVNSEKLAWQNLRDKTQNKCFPYDVNSKRNSISIEIDGENFEVSLKRKDLDKNLSKYPFVKVSKVDMINKSLKFEFVEESSN